MNKNQAEAWVNEITDLLTGKNLITAAVTTIGYRVEIRQNQQFKKAYFVEHGETCSIAIVDTYGVMTGAENWEIDPNKRTILCHPKNAYDEQLHYTWTIAENDDNGIIWYKMLDAQKRLWKVK
jgi:hypothetical protein